MNKINDIKTMVRVAELYYYNKITQQEIARELHISKSKVFRYLQDSIENGIVKITINNPFKSSSKLESYFKERYSLTDVIITPSLEEYSPDNAALAVGAAAANYIANVLSDGMVVGVEWGRTAHCISQELTPLKVKNITLVQLLGCSYRSKYNTDKVVLEFARKLNTVPFTLPFPVVVESAAIKDALLSDSRVAQIYELYDKIDIAVLTVGWTGTDSTNFLEGFVTKSDLKRLSDMGAVADMCGRYFDIDGNICDREFYDRTFGIDFDQIRGTKLPILIANGDKKVRGMVGALNGGLCKVLITDEHTATLAAEEIRARGEPVTRRLQ